MGRYVALHEDTIGGPAPFAQVAIEYEIERLSVDVGPSLLAQIERVLGAWSLECLSFLTDHVELDAGHTALNERLLERLLTARPESLGTLVDTGMRALSAYLDFLEECLESASRAERARLPLAAAASTDGWGAETSA